MNVRYLTNGGMDKIDSLERLTQERWIGECIYAKVKELFSGLRLLYALIILLIITVVSLYTMIKDIITLLPIKSVICGILGVGPIFSILVNWELSRNIVGRFYYLSPLKNYLSPFSLKKGVYLIIGILIGWIWLFVSTKEWFYRHAFIPIIFGFPISLLINIIWLINYEKVHGKVYVKREQRPLDK